MKNVIIYLFINLITIINDNIICNKNNLHRYSLVSQNFILHRFLYFYFLHAEYWALLRVHTRVEPRIFIHIINDYY